MNERLENYTTLNTQNRYLRAKKKKKTYVCIWTTKVHILSYEQTNTPILVMLIINYNLNIRDLIQHVITDNTVECEDVDTQMEPTEVLL